MNNRINKIVIACFKKDLFLLRPCVASIRYWYPDVEIFLLKDEIQGDFSLNEFIDNFSCKIFKTNMKTFGWPWSKLSVLLKEEEDTFLFLDSDIVFLGPVLDELNKYNEDFIVTGAKIDNQNSENFVFNYIDTNKLKSFDKNYVFPGFGFNGGQIVMKSGVLKMKDFTPIINFNPTIKSIYPEIFKHGDQGCLNYIFNKAAIEKRITLRYVDFWIWPGLPEARNIELNKIKNKDGYNYVLHWAGVKPVDFRKYIRYDLLNFYTKEYYARVPFGKIKYFFRYNKLLAIVKAKHFKYWLFNMEYAK